MKLNGIVVKIERETIIPIIADTGNFYLIAKPIHSYEPFDTMCERPKPRMGGEPGNEKPLVESRDYREALIEYSKKFNDWVVVSSITEAADSEGNRFPMEWEKVDIENIETYKEWQDELLGNGFSDTDLRRIELEVFRCNQMDEKMIEAAKDHFLAIRKAPATS